MSARSIGHAAGGLGGGWGRYRTEAGGHLIGPSAVGARVLGIVEGEGWLRFLETTDLRVWELGHDAVLDGDGPVCVVERPRRDERVGRLLLDCYLLGDARVSSAAGALLEERARAL